MGGTSATIAGRLGAAGRRWLSVALSAWIATAALADPGTPDPPPHPARWETLDGPRVPIAGAAGVSLERGPALVGGFTDRLEATAAIQVRDPRHGWMPVGSALVQPRAEATAIPLADGTVLVIGGWDGRLPDDVRHLGSAERLDPWNPAIRRPIPPPFADRGDAGLEGHAACGLADGRVLVVHRRQGTIFDPATDDWSPPFRLTTDRRHATLVAMPSTSSGEIDVVIIGGGRRADDPAIETIRIAADGTAIAEAWPTTTVPAALGRAAALAVGREIVVAGGELLGRSVSTTWRLDPAARTAESGPDLPVPDGVADGRLARTGARLVLLGGESIVEGRPVPVANGAVLHPRLDRLWALPAGPVAAVRSTVLATEGRGPEIVGGYRFDRSAPRGARTRVLGDDVRLRLPSLLIDD